MNKNTAILIGRVTNDLELKSTNNGKQVVSFGLATKEVWKDQNGEKQEKTEFHNIVAWGKQAETLAQYVVKGQEIYVEGRLETRTWDSEDGHKNYKTEIVLSNFQFGQKPQGVENDVPQDAQQVAPPTQADNQQVEEELDVPF